jgi:hypothetical protein
LGKLPNHFCTSALAAGVSKSPAISKVALEGTYHFLKKFFTSSIEACARSSWRPMVMWR